jgi:hypothetical protein
MSFDRAKVVANFLALRSLLPVAAEAMTSSVRRVWN